MQAQLTKLSSFEQSLFDCTINKSPRGTKIITVSCPLLPKGYCIAITGETEELGMWDVKKALPLTRTSADICKIALDKLKNLDNAQFKLIIVKNNGSKVIWEQGENRYYADWLSEATIEFRGDFPKPKAAGVAIPLFSLMTERSFGIGDFNDLEKFIEWAANCGFKVVQLLPLNDTTSTRTQKDSYPYNAISAFALHPLYLSVNKMGELKDVDLAHQIADMQQKLNRFEQIDYEEVDKAKWLYFRAIYAQNGDKTIRSQEFKDFYTENQEWLMPYSVFCHLRDTHKTADFNSWGHWSAYSEESAKAMLAQEGTDNMEVMIHAYLQFHLHKQLTNAKEVAIKNGVSLKGDIPIGVSPISVEAWSNPELFNIAEQAGAPPDAFATEGQNWGFPTYNWAQMKLDGYKWWVKRFQKMAQYCDLYRIDHILGFFRIWSIPQEFTTAIMGQFNPAKPLTKAELKKLIPEFKVNRFAKPYITFETIKIHLGKHANFYSQYIDKHSVDGVKQYELKPEYDTQKKIHAFFADQEPNENNQEIKQGLCKLITEVLFVADIHNPDTFHPRIAAQFTQTYESLTQPQKDSYNTLYNDFFYRRHNDFWAESGYEKLEAITKSNPMLCCGEDLGMIPDCVAPVMAKLGILSLEVERMPKKQGAEFADISQNPYLSVDTIATHDMSPLRQWWQELSDNSKTDFFYNVMQFTGNLPKDLTADMCQKIIEKHLNCPSILTIIAWQDIMAMHKELRLENPLKEQINIPADPNHAWDYRMHLNIKQIKTARNLTKRIKQILDLSDRD